MHHRLSLGRDSTDRVKALITALRARPARGGSVQQSCMLAAQAVARRTGDRVLEAEAAMLAWRQLAPCGTPAYTLAKLSQAREIFEANRLPHRALAARVGMGFAQCLLGEERQAFATVSAVLEQPALLRPEDEAAAVYVAALALGRLGALDEARRWIDERGLRLADACAQAWPVLPARMAWARACIAWLSFMAVRQPVDLQPQPQAAAARPAAQVPTASQLARLFERAQRLLPPDDAWPYGDVCIEVLRGLGESAEARDAAVAALEALSRRWQRDDPPAAGWALLGCAAVLLPAHRLQPALQAVLRARALAETMQLDSLRRDVLAYESAIREALGDAVGALAALKQLYALRIASLSGGPPALPATCATDAAPALPQPLRNLEPAHVRRALRFIDEHLREPLPVQAVVAHCEVGRRTLEIAFRRSRGCTLAEHIRQSKLQLAADELLRTLQPVQQVARSLGYGSAAAFSRDFAARYGMPPSAWARQYRDAR